MYGRFSHQPLPIHNRKTPGVDNCLNARQGNRYGDSLHGDFGNFFPGRHIHTGKRNRVNNTRVHRRFHRTHFFYDANTCAFSSRNHHALANVLPCIPFGQRSAVRKRAS